MTQVKKKIIVMTVASRTGSNSVYAANIFIKTCADHFIVEHIALPQAHIERYVDTRDEATPIFHDEDDFNGIITKILDADAFVIFSPIYWYNYPSLLKQFIDRISGVQSRPAFAFRQKVHNKPWAYVVVSGGDDKRTRDAFWVLHQEVCTFVGAKLIRGPWFVALHAHELETKQSTFVEQTIKTFVHTLTSELK